MLALLKFQVKIELLQEYKQAIITEVVTGHRCVVEHSEIAYEAEPAPYGIAAEP